MNYNGRFVSQAIYSQWSIKVSLNNTPHLSLIWDRNESIQNASLMQKCLANRAILIQNRKTSGNSRECNRLHKHENIFQLLSSNNTKDIMNVELFSIIACDQHKIHFASLS
jgi:hypothetical protein